MTYSHEVEMMCPVSPGRASRCSSDSGGSKMGKSKRDQRHFRIHSRYWLVRTAAGYLQTDSERKRGRYPGSSR